MNTAVRDFIRRCSWIPAFAGMTIYTSRCPKAWLTIF
jgi:hypothetical protein